MAMAAGKSGGRALRMTDNASKPPTEAAMAITRNEPLSRADESFGAAALAGFGARRLSDVIVFMNFICAACGFGFMLGGTAGGEGYLAGMPGSMRWAGRVGQHPIAPPMLRTHDRVFPGTAGPPATPISPLAINSPRYARTSFSCHTHRRHQTRAAP